MPRAIQLDQSANRGRVEVSAAAERTALEGVLYHLSELLTEPASQRSPETALRTIDRFPGKVGLHRPLEERFPDAAALLQTCRNPCGEAYQIEVEQGYAHLDSHRHSGAIRIVQ